MFDFYQRVSGRYAIFAFKSLDPHESGLLVCEAQWRDEAIVLGWQHTGELLSMGYRYSYVRPV